MPDAGQGRPGGSLLSFADSSEFEPSTGEDEFQMLDVVFGQASDPGKLRPHNEDAASAFIPSSRTETRSRGWMFAIADGAGGRDLGEIASKKAVDVIFQGFAAASEGASLATLLPRLIRQANAAVHDESLRAQRRGRDMGTTVVACVLRYDRVVVSHVGDSRCYQVRNRNINLITRDHTWAAEQSRVGVLTGREAEQSANRHVLTRSLGPELSVAVDTETVLLEKGDVLVLCTDGLYNAMYPEDISRFASQNKDPRTIARELVNYAVESDGSDNATVQIIKVLTTEPEEVSRDHLYTLQTRNE